MDTVQELKARIAEQEAQLEKLNWIIDRLYEDHPCCNPDRD